MFPEMWLERNFLFLIIFYDSEFVFVILYSIVIYSQSVLCISDYDGIFSKGTGYFQSPLFILFILDLVYSAFEII